MTDGTDAARVAAGLGDQLATLTFTDLGTEQVTRTIIDAVVRWGAGQGWRVYRRAASVLPLPPPMQGRHSVVDVACARPGAPPLVIEVDHTDRHRTVEKLLAEAAAGRVAIWVRWGSRGFTAPPEPVRMVTLPVTVRTTAARPGVRLFSRQPERPLAPPSHRPGPVAVAGPPSPLFDPADGEPPGGE
ncbi:hypothetical protein EDC02_5875 [Micromonospora sp. Llam0]|uniref:hypothetical protein n=1 Tax=Micromonospora sp. Llam0 TaxID=2485143 RepID=UPI000FBAC2C5|nr:hypothetical protein [Micromonospora sp. Llam0]ROO51012.1 hypothetical protein EDC02_5875 [Micromonospora sp. Llam0]